MVFDVLLLLPRLLVNVVLEPSFWVTVVESPAVVFLQLFLAVSAGEDYLGVFRCVTVEVEVSLFGIFPEEVVLVVVDLDLFRYLLSSVG